ncbi:MAG: signal peptidase I [Acidimicrobiales bacterium]
MTLTDEQQAERVPGQDGKPAKVDRKRILVEWVVIVVVALVAALLIKTFAIQAFYIPSPSMFPTLKPGDRVLVNKLSYDFHPVHPGDVIVFRRPPGDNDPSIDDLIKRVVATGGQKLYVANCRIYINGKQLAQPWLPKGWQNPSSPYCTTWPSTGLPNPYTVPKGDLFMMGDNRKDSYDSRYWGPLPGSYIVGRAFVLMWPPGRVRFL